MDYNALKGTKTLDVLNLFSPKGLLEIQTVDTVSRPILAIV